MSNILRLFTFVFFPIIRIGFPLPVPIIYVFLLRKWEFLKSYFYPLFFSSLYLLIVIVISNHKNLDLGDLAYSAFPLIYLVLIQVFTKMNNTHKIIKVYFYANIAIVLLTSFFIPSILEMYYNSYVFGNITSSDHYLESVYSRGIGLLGHPAWLALMVYMLGKFLAITEGKYRYVLLSVIPIALSGGRAALFVMIILEFYFLVIKNRNSPVKFFRNLILSMLLSVLVFWIVYEVSDSFKYFIDITLYDLKYGGGDFRSGSIDNRLDMFKLLFEQNPLVILFGGGAILSSLDAAAIDTEFVMRSLQFGLIGFLTLLFPTLIARRNSKMAGNSKGKEISTFLFLFCVLGSLTTTIASNMIFMIYISVMIAIVEQMNKKSRVKLEKEKKNKVA